MTFRKASVSSLRVAAGRRAGWRNKSAAMPAKRRLITSEIVAWLRDSRDLKDGRDEKESCS